MISGANCYNLFMIEIILLIHNIRSSHNVGSILRTAEAFGIKEIYFSGYSPYPSLSDDTRLPHIREKIAKNISKTALGAEKHLKIDRFDEPPIDNLRNKGYKIVALEQHPSSLNIRSYKPSTKIALLLGEEVHGIEPDLLSRCDEIIEIPMQGKKESFNVSVATGIALYQLTT